MAKSKSKAVKKTAADLEDEAQEKQDAELLPFLPFVRDTRGEPYHKDAGIFWWKVADPEYWHQGICIGESFADRVAQVLPRNPERIEQVLKHSLHSMLHQGGSNGIALGFLDRIAHYAVKGMQQTGASHE